MKLSTRLNFKQVLTATAVFISRLGLLPANLSPVGSFGFFGNPILYALSLVAFDFLVGGIYKNMLFTYAGFGAYALLGQIARDNVKRQVVLLPVASFLFFLLSNLGSFVYWYPQTWTGLVACYVAALPFYTRTLIGDVFFGYGYLLVKVALTRSHFLHNQHARHLLKPPRVALKISKL